MEKSIGFFDSGLGGLSVLREALKLMPNENYIYFGDSKNAPYGSKTIDEIRELTFSSVEYLLGKNVKAVVIACNTATSVAIEELRRKYSDIPIVGIEPAVKPAVTMNPDGKIIIMATPVTLQQRKFKSLYEQYKSDSEIVPMPCAELVSFVEKGETCGFEIEEYLRGKFNHYEISHIGAVVLGCTHFPFVEESIRKVVGDNIPIIHGGYGTAKRLRYLLEEKHIINKSEHEGKVEIYNSLNNPFILEIARKLLYGL
ncbi:glutamate racemase [Hathewaya proteolytica DSM 3090]|uniref:Glutamate racemase n=1 Tax=Hathewaya proteolytica DSM 3090 TaxID=1121331 RepID=A0A1M6MFR0_9CLOT|nr:glutamate racemase [Hathewaya proteolytica]SHJ82196.1 glutamate racemase [Hathewaya proteolytica DSM 3090]